MVHRGHGEDVGFVHVEVEDALASKDADSLVFETGDTLARVEEMGDLFEPMLTLQQELPALG